MTNVLLKVYSDTDLLIKIFINAESLFELRAPGCTTDVQNLI